MEKSLKLARSSQKHVLTRRISAGGLPISPRPMRCDKHLLRYNEYDGWVKHGSLSTFLELGLDEYCKKKGENHSNLPCGMRQPPSSIILLQREHLAANGHSAGGSVDKTADSMEYIQASTDVQIK